MFGKLKKIWSSFTGERQYTIPECLEVEDLVEIFQEIGKCSSITREELKTLIDLQELDLLEQRSVLTRKPLGVKKSGYVKQSRGSQSLIDQVESQEYHPYRGNSVGGAIEIPQRVTKAKLVKVLLSCLRIDQIDPDQVNLMLRSVDIPAYLEKKLREDYNFATQQLRKLSILHEQEGRFFYISEYDSIGNKVFYLPDIDTILSRMHQEDVDNIQEMEEMGMEPTLMPIPLNSMESLVDKSAFARQTFLGKGSKYWNAILPENEIDLIYYPLDLEYRLENGEIENKFFGGQNKEEFVLENEGFLFMVLPTRFNRTTQLYNDLSKKESVDLNKRFFDRQKEEGLSGLTVEADFIYRILAASKDPKNFDVFLGGSNSAGDIRLSNLITGNVWRNSSSLITSTPIDRTISIGPSSVIIKRPGIFTSLAGVRIKKKFFKY